MLLLQNRKDTKLTRAVSSSKEIARQVLNWLSPSCRNRCSTTLLTPRRYPNSDGLRAPVRWLFHVSGPRTVPCHAPSRQRSVHKCPGWLPYWPHDSPTCKIKPIFIDSPIKPSLKPKLSIKFQDTPPTPPSTKLKPHCRTSLPPQPSVGACQSYLLGSATSAQRLIALSKLAIQKLTKGIHMVQSSS